LNIFAGYAAVKRSTQTEQIN